MIIFYLSSFIFGAAIGSFLNVVIDRLPKGESIIRGRSYCDFCDHQLRWYELIPLLSFILQRGKCRECGEGLSLQYPLVEFLTGILTMVVVFSVFGLPSSNISLPPSALRLPALLITSYYLLVTYALFAIAAIDFKEGIIPDKLTLVLILVTLFYLVCVTTSRPRVFYTHLGVGLGAAGFLWLLATGASRVLGKPAMGFGDVKFAFAMGLILGWPNIVIGMYLAFVLGAAVALLLMALKRKRFGQTIPFGPFLAAATWVVMVYGEKITQFYLRFLAR